MTEERLEKLYWELGELEGEPYLLDWSDDDIKRLNITKLNIWGIIYKNFHSGEKPEKVMRDMIARRRKK